MPYALTDAPADQPARTFLTNTRRFPLEGATTTDLAKALTWRDRSGPHRFRKRRPDLAGFRQIPIDVATLAAVRAADASAAGQLPAPDPANIRPRRSNGRNVKRGKGKARSKRIKFVTKPANGPRRPGKAHLRRPTPSKGSKAVRGAKRRSKAAA